MKRPRKRKPVYSAKPSAPWNEGEIVTDTGWNVNPLTGFKERTMVKRGKPGVYDVTIQNEGGIFLPPPEDPNGGGILSFQTPTK